VKLVKKLLRGLLLKPTLNLLNWILRSRNGNSLIGGGPLGWNWYATLAAMATDHHGNMSGFGGSHHAHGQLSGVGIDDHHARDHASRHGSGGADAVTLDASQIGTGRFGMARMPDGTSGHVLTAQGAGNNPAYAPVTVEVNKVKLPSPSESDYITPSAATASSSPSADISNDTGTSDGGNIMQGQRATPPDGGGFVTSVKMGIYFDNSVMETPTNYTVTLQIRRVSDDAVLWQGNKSGTIGGLWAGIVMVEWNPNYLVEAEVRIVVSNFHWGRARYRNANVCAGVYTSYSGGAWTDNASYDYRIILVWTPRPDWTRDDSTSSFWVPSPPNEAGAWIRWDTGALKILGGARIYWGADSAYLPTAYRLQVSEDGTTWVTVVTETAAPTPSAWKEYSWNARYCRYLRLVIDSHGSSGTRVFEADYYSRITDRVAAEHGHGSGITPYLEVIYSEGHPQMAFGDTLREKVNQARNKMETGLTVAALAAVVEAQNELIEFLTRG